MPTKQYFHIQQVQWTWWIATQRTTRQLCFNYCRLAPIMYNSTVFQ